MERTHHTKATHTCEQCGKSFTHRRHGTNRFCSKLCDIASRRVSIDRICPNCGKPVTAAKRTTKFCSMSCFAGFKYRAAPLPPYEGSAPSNTVRVPLGHGKFAVIDMCDADRVLARKWHVKIKTHACYAYGYFPGPDGKSSSIALHRFILDAPSGVQVDHIDHDGLNNTRANLRLATPRENQWNKRACHHGRSGYKGVHWVNKSSLWRARIHDEAGKLCHLGYFDSPTEAARVYDAAAKRMHGNFAYLNFPEDAGLVNDGE